MSSGVRVPSKFAVHTLLDIFLQNRPQTKTHVRRQFISVYGKARALHFTATLLQARAVDAAPQFGAPQRDEEAQIDRRAVGDRRCPKHFSSLSLGSRLHSKCNRTRTRTNTNPNDTEASAAGRSGNARALRKQSKCGVIHEGEGHRPNFSQILQKSEALVGSAHSPQ